MKRQTHRTAFFLAIVTFTILFHAAPVRAQSVYVTASTGGTSTFGAVNLATGQFSQISATNQGFAGLTTGAGGTIFGADGFSGHLYTISPTGVTTQFGSSVAPPDLFYGLAYSGTGKNFFAANLQRVPDNMTLYSISGDGNSNSSVGLMTGPPAEFASGGLAFDSSGDLYFDYSTDVPNGANPILYTVNTSTGGLTAVGGLGSPLLTLFSVGSTLYGIDTVDTSNIGIYTINTGTGLATFTGVNVTGLPSGFTLDTATFSAPDSGSTLGLFALALAALVGASRFRSLRLA